ncbi:5'-nucleotidase /3'-nucleotidase /exopolyphosphatase [Oceanospirillum multiglobuliferum]|uniref:5'-nucleotidase SurE n=1 Tax=Oceanospirillum multiglobuliferum TaxID=64969 RepID=A0A1T4RUD0_9GAMM|nr:5'/3'-nucleotidase SurE [Oceanospirillum multiglobuliferum]OPX54626.1 5'/3'-nucleotidase SurE [Oceanospirillum multiglobuliferum]SKA19575.1 5'-nucleotidase /3'-nucleotidase /exopolyphosphatase [Oceanospirillum multiglobuliferum]
MKLLLSNDDGVRAEGLKVLAQRLAEEIEVERITVVAPDRDRSGASNSLTLSRPLCPEQMENGFYSIDGTPTDCVYMGLSKLFNSQADLVIAGINHGGNLGDDVLYSGTVAAATEGRFLGVPSIAVSLVGKQHFATAAEVVVKVLRRYQNLALPTGTILNINVPDLPFNQLKGIRLTQLGHRHQAGEPEAVKDPRGKLRYWIPAAGSIRDAGPETDFYAIEQGYVSITPLHVDLTHQAAVKPLAQWLDGLIGEIG